MVRLLMITTLVVLTLTVFAVSDAYAQESEVVYKKHTVVSFDDDTIDGDLSKPDGQYIDARKRQRHRSLIKVRETFRQEILRSVRVL
ncbi:MAG: adventurous gliding motility protein CglF [Myxococcota bacterium]